jgi:spheroidene monooxygenase
MSTAGAPVLERRGDATPDAPFTPPDRSLEPAAQDAGRARAGGAVSVLVLAQVHPRDWAWGWSRLVRGPAALSREPGLRFAKVLGSGHEGGFGLRPSGTRHGLFCTFADADSAQRFLAESALMARYRAHGRELFTVRLRAFACKGSWSGVSLPLAADAPPPDQPLAALTRASIRPAAAARFWRLAPAAQAGLADAEGCSLAVGLGEAPLLRQCTFSLWDSVAHMDRYARSGAHLAAIRAAYQVGFFSESMFVRFVPSDAQGTWLGRRFGPAGGAPAATG